MCVKETFPFHVFFQLRRRNIAIARQKETTLPAETNKPATLVNIYYVRLRAIVSLCIIIFRALEYFAQYAEPVGVWAIFLRVHFIILIIKSSYQLDIDFWTWAIECDDDINFFFFSFLSISISLGKY